MARWQASYDAGFQWAMDRKIHSLAKCPEKRGPFRKGCIEWVAAQAS